MNSNDFKEKFAKAWANPKYKAAIKLGFYLLVIIAISIIAAVGSRIKTTIEEETEVKTYTYSEKIALLKEHNYAYIYEVNKGEDKTLFTGVRLNQKELGFKETALNNIKYYIDDETYEIVFGEKVLTTPLYEDVDPELINIDTIFNNIDALKGELNTTSWETYYSYYDILKRLTINIYFSVDRITKITTTTEEYSCILKFSKIGEITEKDLTF